MEALVAAQAAAREDPRCCYGELVNVPRARSIEALDADPGFAKGLNTKAGEITYGPVAGAYAQGAPVAAW